MHLCVIAPCVDNPESGMFRFSALFQPSVLAPRILHNAVPPLPSPDIAGANAAGWSSVLVRTGVYDRANGPPAHTPTYEAEDVEDAVQWAIEREINQAARVRC
jgi:HAD-hyrolase-like